MIKATRKTQTKVYSSKLKIKSNDDKDCSLNSEEQNSDQSLPLKKLSLRGNQLCGSILIGNYNYLTQLEVCENEMEVLDLSGLGQLETLKCSYNKLSELMLNGSNLTTLIANNNCLNSISAKPSPTKLTSLDISHNNFVDLPKWIGTSCICLYTLHANNNQLQSVEEFLLNNHMHKLKILNLAYNNLYGLRALPHNFCSLEKLYLQSNEIQKLPENFFTVTHKALKILNLSCNKLQTLPRYELSQTWQLEDLYISSNYLTENIFNILQWAAKLKVLHVAYNKIRDLSETCLENWSNLEVLVLSGNMLQQLPDKVVALKQLQVLRVHSNLLLSTPQLCKLFNLKVLDLAHNHLDHINLLNIMSKQLKYLDLSYNLQLQVDEQQVKVCQTQRNWSLIDVSGKNRVCLPTNKLNEFNENVVKPPWVVGFSETPGHSRKLLVCQLRLCNYRANEGLFGMFESKVSSKIANSFAKIVPTILQQEQEIKETLNEYMKYTLLTAEQRINVNSGFCAILCHLAKENYRGKTGMIRSSKSKRYVLRVASFGTIGAYIVKKTSNIALTNNCNKKEECRAQGVVQDPEVMEIALSNDDEFIVICNGHLWTVMDINRLARELRKEENAVLAAKRIQDIAQSFGAMDNLSIIVVRLNNMGTDVDHLIKEFKRSVRKKSVSPLTQTVCKRTCCDRSNACQHRFVEGFNNQLSPRSFQFVRGDRTSPSGQSDELLNTFNKEGSGNADNDKDFVLAHAQVVEEENELEMLAETDSVLSEEQFKCWEYMLEQNTQLLFDKELNTISKSFTKNRNVERKTHMSQEHKSNLINSVRNKFISHSSPQLLQSETKKPFGSYQQHVSFLTKRFGSNRSFQADAGYNIFDSRNRDSLAPIGSKSKFGGGPNAAYFGSLQRLMPYNSEYDFAITQEKSVFGQGGDDGNEHDDDDDDDYHDHDSRIRKYWGVATTEL